MREFFVLTHDDRDDLQSVSDYEVDDFDLTVFWSGNSFPSTIPDGVKLFLSEGDKSDYLGNPISWAIVSDRFLAHIVNLAGNALQIFAAPTYDQNTFKPISGYSVVNVTRCLPALAKPLTSVDRIVLNLASIPSNVHLFRVVGHETLLFVSEEFLEELRGEGLQGIAFIKTKCI
ncbi:hypothetical protein Pan153_42300 [Gimesia panareensis]|uniref:Uncharacterized protein n=1 Tax=Gimesia panareensis TaxID=2527978 RepID=A0A518FTA0_9PLAN|nr:hypothetical protein [Gimesia panareensis]QDV19564.1 hypothetical protein Pan153_42300 [Gimesia panareensis]